MTLQVRNADRDAMPQRLPGRAERSLCSAQQREGPMNAKSTRRGATRRGAHRVAWFLSLLSFLSMSAAADMNLGSMLSDLWCNSPPRSQDGRGMTVDRQDRVMFVTVCVCRADTSAC
jgi:hypothetical protein